MGGILSYLFGGGREGALIRENERLAREHQQKVERERAEARAPNRPVGETRAGRYVHLPIPLHAIPVEEVIPLLMWPTLQTPAPGWVTAAIGDRQIGLPMTTTSDQDWRLPNYAVWVRVAGGYLHAKKDDWLVLGTAGQVYPVERSVFLATYIKAQEVREVDGPNVVRAPFPRNGRIYPNDPPPGGSFGG